VVLVNPDVLRAFATQVDTAAETISDIDLGGIATTAADGLPGSETQWATRQVGMTISQGATDLVNDITAMGQAVRGAGDRYEVADADLAEDFGWLF
jgi:uncharacterized protein YukE